jgi:hypothetical protein
VPAESQRGPTGSRLGPVSIGHPERHDSADATIVLMWIPVGAGGHLVGHTSRWWERIHATLAHRKPQLLLHAALEIHVDHDHYVIEMAPQWSGPRVDRGVVATGPVGLRWLGRSTLFRYEVRCWRGGTIPDRRWAVDDPILLSDKADTARLLLRRIRDVPTRVWGRTVPGTGDMWNSNSLVSWLLTVSGVTATDLEPPTGGRAPGWLAGLAMATTPINSRSGDGGVEDSRPNS